MTGFGAATGDVGGRGLDVEIRTVNHRWFNLATRVPPELSAVEGELRDRLRHGFERGHVTVHMRWTVSTEATPLVDAGRAAAVAAELGELQRRLGLDGPLSLDLVLRHVGGPADVAPAAAVEWSVVAPVVDQAIAACRAMRQREGEALADELRQRLAMLEETSDVIGACAPERLVRERDRLAESVQQLVGDRQIDDDRVATELALHADRLDITEELVRLRSHIAAARNALASDQPMGKALGFLAQELGREVNTIGSKANDAAIAHAVVHMKGELEKIREQADNLE
jgi:uncharacterized protein (TIGR00255 family)